MALRNGEYGDNCAVRGLAHAPASPMNTKWTQLRNLDGVGGTDIRVVTMSAKYIKYICHL